MTKIATHNKRRKRERRRAAVIAALVYHYEHVTRLTKSGNLHKLRNSGFVRRMKRREKNA